MMLSVTVRTIQNLLLNGSINSLFSLILGEEEIMSDPIVNNNCRRCHLHSNVALLFFNQIMLIYYCVLQFIFHESDTMY